MADKINFSYLIFRGLTWPISFLPYAWIHRLGRWLGTLIYYIVPNYRKRCFSNLALATSLHFSNQQIKTIAKQSLQNTAIGLLEYAKLFRLKNIDEVATIENPEVMDRLMQTGKGFVAFCGHQANWEALFLAGTSRYPGVAIGRPIKNKAVYQFIVAVREKFGGKIIPPKDAVRGGMKALKSGEFLGVVGDQSFVETGFACEFFGRKAWLSPIAAILAYRVNVPIVVSTTRRENGHYFIKLSEPIYPDLNRPMEEEVRHMMEKAIHVFEESVRQRPGEWFWQHNLWKQQGLGRPKGIFRQECLAIILPENAQEVFHHAEALRKRYPSEFVTLFVPESAAELNLPGVEKIIYHSLDDILIDDYRFKLIFDLSSNPKIRKHFLNLSAVKVVSLENLPAVIR